MFKKKPHVFSTLSTPVGSRRIRAKLAQSFCFCAVLAAWPFLLLAAEPNGPEVHIVVDISGSMKKNDPQNLRIPAVRLVANLMPSNARAGVWTFGQYVNNLIPPQAATPAFRELATAKAADISSKGLFTNIGGAMERAAKPWFGKAQTGPRHMILLTDGVVDISKQPSENAEARNDLLNRLLPQLKAENIRVHSIALSHDADQVLMKKLALETGGQYQLAENAEQLNRLFLRLFEQTTPRDSLPLRDNQFSVDEGADEITILVFKTPDAKPTEVRTPDGEIHSVQQKPVSWRWHTETPYDLITIPKPAAGAWQIIADVDPENRVLLVSKLSMALAELPSVVLAGEQLQLNAQLLDQGAPVANVALLQMVNANARISGEAFRRELVLRPVAEAHFVAPFEVPALDMDYTVEVELSSPTFQRLRRLSLKGVATPLKASVAVDESGIAQLALTPEPDLFQPGSLQVTSELETAAGRSPLTMERSETGFHATVVAEYNGSYRLHYRVQGITAAGRDVVLEMPALEWQVTGLAETPAEPVAQEQTPAVVEPATAEPEKEKPPATETKPDEGITEPEEHSWQYWLVVGVVINVVVFSIVGGIWWWLRRRQQQTNKRIAEELGESGKTS